MKKTKRLLCMLVSVLMVALMVAGCGTEKVENRVLSVTEIVIRKDKEELKEYKGIYTGELKNGKPEGNGVFKYTDKYGNKTTYTGGFKDGKLDGDAIFQLEDGQRREVSYKDGKINGKSKYYFANGKLSIESEWKDGKRDGIFKLYTESGILFWHADYKNGKEVYRKTYYDNGQLLFEGDPNGEGTEYNADRSIKYKGKFVDGKPAN